MVKKLKVLLFSFFWVVASLFNPVYAGAQNCQTINLISGTNTQTVGRNNIPIASDAGALAESNYSPGAWFQAASIIPNPAWVSPLTDVNFATSGAVWVSTGLEDEGSPAEYQWRLYKDSFSIPAGNNINSADVWFTGDNAASVYLNGSIVGTTGGVFEANEDQYFRNVYHAELLPVEGDNILKFVVANWANPFGGGNPTGLLYKATINYCANAPTDKDQCKEDDWQGFTNPKFKNQGECVAYVEHLPAN